MPIEPVTLEQAVCDGCGFDEFHGDYSCVYDATQEVRDADGTVYPDGLVYCVDCMSPDDVEQERGAGYHGDEPEYLDAWDNFRAAQLNRRKPRSPMPEPLGWAHWHPAEEARRA